MLRGSSRLPRLLALLACLLPPAAGAGATEILIDDFSGTPALGVYADLGANGLGQILPFGTAFELDYLGDLLGMRLEYGSLGGIDLTASSNDALALGILSLVPSSGPVYVVVSVNGGPSTPAIPITATGTLLLPYAGFSNSSAFTSVNSLRLVFTADTNFAFAADNLRAIPEPETAAMLGLGLFGLAVAGRREPLIGTPRAAGASGR